MAALLNEAALKQDLGKFPSTFDFDSTNLTKDRVKAIIRKLEDDRKNTRKLKAEDIQISNFLSYLYFLCGDYDHAHQYIDESLQNDPDNIIANVNRARILLETAEISKVEDIITKLQILERSDDYHKRKCYAEADLAYACARSGPWYNQKAVDIYTRVLEAYPTEYAWQYGLGLALLRQTHCFISQADAKFNPRENEKTTVRAAELFLNVATKANDTNLRAYAFASLGKAVYSISKNQYTNVPEGIMQLKPNGYFELALSFGPEEPSVLETCGKYARYRNELDTSEELLRKALQIKPTCQGYHHLALTLKRRVEHNQYREQSVNRTGVGRIKKEKEYSQESRDRSRGSYHGGQVGGQKMVDRPNSYLDDHSKYNQSEEKRLRQLIKSPLEVPVYPGNELLVEAIKLMEKTEELTAFGLVIQYDKGIIYRMLGQIEKAVEVFKKIVTKWKCHSTESPMANVYEQLGLCLLELSKSVDVSPQIQQRHKKDGQVHLMHAIQLQSGIVSKDPQFKEAWNSYSTLKELFSDTRDGKPDQLAVLHMLMGDHRDSIDIYRKLTIEENDKMKPESCVNMLKCYQKEGQFEECVTLLRSWECTTIFAGLPPPLVFDVYTNGAFHAYTTSNAQLAYQHFRRAFKVYGMFDQTNEDQTDVDEDVATKDTLILHSCAQKWKCKLPRNLGTILEDCTGLQYTINTDNVLGNAFVSESMASIIHKIPCIIIITHDSAEVYDKLYVNLAIKMSSERSGPQVLVASDDKCNMPDIARTKPFILLPPPLEGAMKPNDQISEDHKEWVKDFITLLKPK